MNDNTVTKVGLIVSKNDEKRLAYAAVSVPGEADHDGETLTRGEIEHAAHKWMERYQNVDSNHDFQNVATPVESYILPVPMTVKAYDQEMELPEGTWIVASRITDDTTWQAVKDGRLRGHSVTAVRATKSQADKSKTLIRDLGSDWEAATVSIVDTPAVPKALFFAIKGEDNVTDKIQSALKNLQNTISDALAEGKQVDKSGDKPMEIEQIKEAIKEETDALWAEITQKEETEPEAEDIEEAEVPVEVESEVEKSLKAIADRLDMVEKKLGTPEPQAIKGQDYTPPTTPAVKDIYEATGRDAFGRVIKK